MLSLLHLSFAFTVAAGVLPYTLPADFPVSILASDDCVMPQKYTVDSLRIWLPAATNTDYNMTADFHFVDAQTSIDTLCHRNATSPNVADEGDTPRWACENSFVEFIWQDSTLTLIEKACPNNGGYALDTIVQ